MLVRTFGSAVHGVNAVTITIEVNVSNQGIGYSLVGLPDNAVKEGHQRIETAVIHIGLKLPRLRTVINMAPADIRKEGSSYDLPIALGILAAADLMNGELLSKYIVMGELALDGTLKPIKGALPIAIEALKEGFEGFILPRENANEAAIVNNLKVYGAENLKEVMRFFEGTGTLDRFEVDMKYEFEHNLHHTDNDFADVRDQKNISLLNYNILKINIL